MKNNNTATKSNSKKLTDGIKTYDGQFWVYFSFFIALLIIILCLPNWLTNKTWIPLDVSRPNEIGDTLGGTLGPFVAILAAALTFLAFWVQYKANEQQRHDLKIERFENKFYELLRLHRANVEELSIGNNIKGRENFTHLFSELKFCYNIAHKCNQGMLPEPILMDLAYTIFFYGIEPSSEKQFLPKLDEGKKKLYTLCKEKILKYRTRYFDIKSETPAAKFYVVNPAFEESEVFYFTPVNGHANHLAHYFRHLFQTVSYVAEHDERLLDDDRKYSYIKTLRAQLSNDEQLLLFYNAVAWFSNAWHPYFTKFRLIKNIPMGLADFGISPKEFYKDDIALLKEMDIEMFD